MDADQKLHAFELLMSEVSGALADIVTVMQDKNANDSLDTISASLADLVAAMEKRGEFPIIRIVNAIQALRITAPAVTVNNDVKVSPTPIQVMPAPVTVMPSKGCDYEITPTYDAQGAITKMSVKRVQP